MTLIGTLLTSLVFAREWERGTMEAMLATPVSRWQMLLGKLIPYYCMGMFSMGLCALAAVTLFGVPYRGSVGALLFISSVFMLCALGQGLLISVSLHSQLQAAEAGLFSGFLPALLLSGFVFDINSMPPVLQMCIRDRSTAAGRRTPVMPHGVLTALPRRSPCSGPRPGKAGDWKASGRRWPVWLRPGP